MIRVLHTLVRTVLVTFRVSRCAMTTMLLETLHTSALVRPKMRSCMVPMMYMNVDYHSTKEG